MECYAGKLRENNASSPQLLQANVAMVKYQTKVWFSNKPHQRLCAFSITLIEISRGGGGGPIITQNR